MNADLAAAVRLMIDNAGVDRVAEYERRRKARIAERAARKKARDAGLVARHAAKLARKTA